MRVEVVSEEIVQRGMLKTEWANSRMPILRILRKEFEEHKPLEGLRIGMCLHVEPKTASFMQTLKAGGAQVSITGSPGTTDDDVAMAVASTGIEVFGHKADQRADHLENIRAVLDSKPHLLMDNGADLVATYIDAYKYQGLLGGIEETTSGANRLRSDYAGKVAFPVIVINDSPLKLIVENEHGVGQTVVEGIMRATNLMVPGKRFVVFGYGSCGKGVSQYLRKFNAQVIVVETDPIRALEAVVAGIDVAELEDILEWGEVFVTVTGMPDVLMFEDIEKMNSGAILVNAGHFSTELDLTTLRDQAVSCARLTADIEKFVLQDGKEIFLLAGGEMINLASGKGNPVETMDLGLALQVLSIREVAQNQKSLLHGPQPVPQAINYRVAKLMLQTIYTMKSKTL